MLRIFSASLHTAARQTSWDAPDHWRNIDPPRSSSAARRRDREWLRQAMGRTGLL